MKRLALALAALFLFGCTTPDSRVIEPPPVYGLDGTSLVEGTSEVIIAYTSHDAIEGGPELSPVDDIRSDDPSIVVLEFTTHEYEITTGRQTLGVVVYAVHAGTTNLRLFDGETDRGTLPITVVAVGQ